MSILDKLQKLGSYEKLFEELQIAKLEVLGSLRGPLDPSNADHLEVIRTLNSIERLDLKWALKWEPKRKYYTTIGIGRNGFWEGFMTGFGITSTLFWMRISLITDVSFPLSFSVLLTLFGVVMHIRAWVKSREYFKAEKSYLCRQKDLVERACDEFNRLNLDE
jgi:hypothetical protein